MAKQVGQYEEYWNYGGFNTEIATKIGLTEAIVFDYIYRMLKLEPNIIEYGTNREWIQMSADEWKTHMRWYSTKTIRRAINTLVKYELIQTRQLSGFDRRLCITINFDNLHEYIGESDYRIV